LVNFFIKATTFQEDSFREYMVSVSDAFSGTSATCEGLTIQPISFDDLDEMANWPQFEERELAWANFPAKTTELRKRWYLQQQKDHLQWLIVRDHSNEMIGRCSLTQPLSGGSLIFGLVIRPDKLGQGLGTQITKMMVSYTFKVIQQEEIEAIWLESRVDNIRAQKTWEKVGFVRQGEHMRREIYGRYDRYIGYLLDRSVFEKGGFPSVDIITI